MKRRLAGAAATGPGARRALGAAAASAALLLGPAAAAGDPIELHALFKLAPGFGWAVVQLEAKDWRLGSPGGPVAAPDQVRAALDQPHSLHIGGRCAGWAESATSYPCGVEVDGLVRGDRSLLPYAMRAYGWEITPEVRQRVLSRSSDDLRASPLISPLPDAPQWVGVQLRVPRVAEHADRVATLSFRIRALSNVFAPSTFERASGSVVLRAGAAIEPLPQD
jgi:hypothetical protein